MCAPAVLPLALSLGQFAIGAVSSFAQYRGQQQVADNQAQYQANLASLEQERYLREQTQLQQQYSQEVLSRQMHLWVYLKKLEQCVLR